MKKIRVVYMTCEDGYHVKRISWRTADELLKKFPKKFTLTWIFTNPLNNSIEEEGYMLSIN